jgi:CMP-N,N'-diacetyllegionaminic acid synthase
MNIQGMLGLITARSGSQRLRDKNVRKFGSSSLVEISIREALGTEHLDHIGFSTDSAAYLELANRSGLQECYLRPADLATAQATSADCVIHYVDWVQAQKPNSSFTHVVLMQPTNPFRTSAHIDKAVVQLRESGRQSLVSATPTAPGSGYILTVDGVRGRLEQRSRENPIPYVLDGALFITPIDMLRERNRFWDEDSELYVMHYPRYFDIDTEEDFVAADAIWRIGK